MRLTVCTTLAAIAVSFSVSALADDNGRNNNNGSGNNGSSRFESGLVGSVPNAPVGGVPSGGAPWVLASSEASISGDGRLHLEVSGLLIGAGGPANLVGTVATVKMVAASLVCGGTVAASSDGTPLSATGHAAIDTTIKLPATCMAPVVLVRIFNPTPPVGGTQLGSYIAVSGFSAGAAANNNNDDKNVKEGNDRQID